VGPAFGAAPRVAVSLWVAAALWVAAVAGPPPAAGAPRADAELGLPAGRRPAEPPSAAVLDQLATRGLPFGPGERLVFSIEYGPVHAGTATMEVSPMLAYRGRSCYHIVSQTQSSPFFDSIYRVRDRIDTLVDAERLVTWQYRKVQREGTYSADHQTIYDQDGHRARYADHTVLTIPPRALDALGAFYFARAQKLEPGTSFFIPHHSDKRSFYLEVRVLGRERIKVPAGTFNCVAVEPYVKDAGPFRHQGQLTIWLTDDARHLPVLMKSKVPVGSINAVLQQITYGTAPRPARTRAGAGS
jgi:hypothetical protein